MSTIKEVESQLRKAKRRIKELEKELEFTRERLTGSYDRNFSLRTALINSPIDEIIALKKKHMELQQENLNG
tara:strand:+ start:336 stop:551 length:216 start_codon:yes stop_codon:yes gene_type:complete